MVAKEKEIIPIDSTEISFEMGWVENNPRQEGSIPKGHDKGKNKVNGTSNLDIAPPELGLD